MNKIPKGYKMTEVGVIPVDWDFNKLGEIACVKTGNTPPTNDKSNYGSDYFFVSPADLGKGKYIIDTEKKLSKKGFELSRKFPANSILFTCIGSTIGKSGISKKELTSNQQINAILPDKSFCHDYLYYALNKLSPIIQSLAGEQAVPIINKSEFEETLIPLPPLPEQVVIAEALSDTDTLIGKLEELITKKRQTKQGAMQELLTGKKRLPGFSGKWEEKTLGTIFEKIVGGGTPSRANSNYWGGNIPWVTVKDFATFNPHMTQESITKDGLKNSASHLIPEGTVIISTRMALGKAVIYDVDVSINQDLKALFPLKDINQYFLFYWFQFYSEQIMNLGSGSTVMGISLPDLKKISFSKPSLSEQLAITAILSEMDAEIEQLDKKLEKYKMVKKGMMQELLTGKTRLI